MNYKLSHFCNVQFYNVLYRIQILKQMFNSVSSWNALILTETDFDDIVKVLKVY